MAEITIFPGYVRLPNREHVEPVDLQTTFRSLDDVYYDVVDMHGFQLEEHLRATERCFPQDAQGWFKQHSTSPGYALRYDNKTTVEVAERVKLPVIRLWPEEEPYLLIYELGPITMVQLAIYQAIFWGSVESYLLDVIFSDYFPLVARDVVGPEILGVACRRLYRIKYMDFYTDERMGWKPRPKPPQPRNGRRPQGYYMYGPNKGKPYYGPEG